MPYLDQSTMNYKYRKVIDLYYEYISAMIRSLSTTKEEEYDELRDHILTQIELLWKLQEHN